MSGRLRFAVLAVPVLACAAGDEEAAPPPVDPVEEPRVVGAPAPTWVGGETCASCHPAEAERWRGSHHDLAMQEANEETLLGDFDGATLTHYGVTTTFSRRDGRPVVTTDGPDGALRDYEIAYTFGVDPLQQLLISFPGGRLQALGIAWDSRPADEGGQRWFHLHPDEAVPHDDLLHWTGPNQNWNSMCAECHSTGLAKRYRADGDRFDTAWAELDVSCEACHGPGSSHVEWARAGSGAGAKDSGLVVDLRNDASWVFPDASDIARRSPARRADAELDVCAPCHARRSPLRDDPMRTGPFLASYRPALLDEGLYYPDGQILDEVYVWGSFLQSRMHAAGVTCSDCHDPHALAIEEPDAVCATCHRPEVFGSSEHHQHPAGSPGASCVGCHMPSREYMSVDPRRDHSFRVPRPDLSEELDTPNACTGCHADRSVAWARERVARWRPDGRGSRDHWGSVLHAGRVREPGAARALSSLAGDAATPAIVRASALRLLREQGAPADASLVGAAARDADPLVRLAALEASESLDPRERLPLARPLLDDPVLAVRVQAASSLAAVPPDLWPPGSRGALADAMAEHRAAQLVNAERPDAHLNLASVHAQFGELDAARRELEVALQLAPWFVPAWINLADVHRAKGREDESERALRSALALAPEMPDAHHALGLALVRQGRSAEAAAELERAAALAPQIARYTYVHGVALHSAGDPDGALRVLKEGHRRHPESGEILLGLATLSRDAGDREGALVYARQLAALVPDDPGAKGLVAELERGAGAR